VTAQTENQQSAIDYFYEREVENDMATEATASLMVKEDLNEITREEVKLLRKVVDAQRRTIDGMNIRLNRAFRIIASLANPVLDGE
jgi:DNA polymerase III delta prime subunit